MHAIMRGLGASDAVRVSQTGIRVRARCAFVVAAGGAEGICHTCVYTVIEVVTRAAVVGRPGNDGDGRAGGAGGVVVDVDSCHRHESIWVGTPGRPDLGEGAGGAAQGQRFAIGVLGEGVVEIIIRHGAPHIRGHHGPARAVDQACPHTLHLTKVFLTRPVGAGAVLAPLVRGQIRVCVF